MSTAEPSTCLEREARRAKRYATSDWMVIEKERGISVTSSVLQFEFLGHAVNLLDTPGHQDFSEDTYRTLTAADSAVMLIDAAKGVETQTRKLFEVCRMRGIPIFTFVNKLTATGAPELMDELKRCCMRAHPMNWPIGPALSFAACTIDAPRTCTSSWPRGVTARRRSKSGFSHWPARRFARC